MYVNDQSNELMELYIIQKKVNEDVNFIKHTFHLK